MIQIIEFFLSKFLGLDKIYESDLRKYIEFEPKLVKIPNRFKILVYEEPDLNPIHTKIFRVFKIT